MMDKEDEDYPDSYWEYLDTIIAHRKANPEPPRKKENDIWRELFQLFTDNMIKKVNYGQEEWIEICKKNYMISERKKDT